MPGRIRLASLDEYVRGLAHARQQNQRAERRGTAVGSDPGCGRARALPARLPACDVLAQKRRGTRPGRIAGLEWVAARTPLQNGAARPAGRACATALGLPKPGSSAGELLRPPACSIPNRSYPAFGRPSVRSFHRALQPLPWRQHPKRRGMRMGRLASPEQVAACCRPTKAACPVTEIFLPTAASSRQIPDLVRKQSPELRRAQGSLAGLVQINLQAFALAVAIKLPDHCAGYIGHGQTLDLPIAAGERPEPSARAPGAELKRLRSNSKLAVGITGRRRLGCSV